MIDASRTISIDLLLSERRRRLRSLCLIGLLLALTLAFPLIAGIRELSLRTMAVWVNGVVLLGIVTVPFYSTIRMEEESALGFTAAAMLLPLFGAVTWSGAPATFACVVPIVLVGGLAMIATRFALGPLRPRFGGARWLQGVAAALVAILSVTLHCAREDAVHLASHVVGALIVAGILRRGLL